MNSTARKSKMQNTIVNLVSFPAMFVLLELTKTRLVLNRYLPAGFRCIHSPWSIVYRLWSFFNYPTNLKSSEAMA